MSAKNKVPRYVLDSYAMLALFEDEPGASRVKTLLQQAEKSQAEILLCNINFGEIVYITEREKGLTAAQNAIALIDQLPITLVEADRKLTLAAAHIKAKHALAYADAFAAALAQTHDAVLVTGDKEFLSVVNQVKIEWLVTK